MIPGILLILTLTPAMLQSGVSKKGSHYFFSAWPDFLNGGLHIYKLLKLKEDDEKFYQISFQCFCSEGAADGLYF